MKPQLIAQAAEAIIYKIGDNIIKDRISKSYRIKELDRKLRKSRTKSETKLLQKAGQIILTPIPINLLINLPQYKSEVASQSFQIVMPFIDGKKLSEHLDDFPLAKQKQILKQIGQDVAKLHDNSIIHGDLTTSNMILVENSPAYLHPQINNMSVNKKTFNEKDPALTKLSRSALMKSGTEPSNFAKNGKDLGERGCELLISEAKSGVYFIDFGLAFISNRTEDKAVDIHLLKQALEAKHFKNWEGLFKAFLGGYSKSKNYKETIERLRKVEMRGRYKH